MLIAATAGLLPARRDPAARLSQPPVELEGEAGRSFAPWQAVEDGLLERRETSAPSTSEGRGARVRPWWISMAIGSPENTGLPVSIQKATRARE